MCSDKKSINMLNNILYDQGFCKYKHSMYRCVGQGILQVVNPVGPKSTVEEKNYTYEKTVLFGVYSLYGSIPWSLGIGNTPNGVPATIASHCLIHNKTISFPGTTEAIEIMLQYGVPLLNEVSNHSQLANALEHFDQQIMGQVRLNDTKKIAPYIISGTPNKAVEVIAAIERQNWDAYQSNFNTIPNYNATRHRIKIENRLRPIQEIKDAIIKCDALTLRAILEECYRINKSVLSKLSIPLRDDCVANLDTIRF